MYLCVRAYMRVPYKIYIRRGLRCCCLDKKAIPEPRLAEQQDCSPAFVFLENKVEHCLTGSRFRFLYCGASILEAPLFHKYALNSVCIGTEFFFDIFLYLFILYFVPMQHFGRY